MVPKIIAIANTKGGTGKTTLTIQLAAARAQQGFDVWVVDGDPQQTASTALTLRESPVFISCSSYSNGSLLGAQVQRQAEKWDTVFIDVGGFDSTTMRMAMTICDVLLIPFQPRTFDTWAFARMSSLIEECKVARGGRNIPAYAVINAADNNNSSDNKDAAQVLEDYPQIKLLDCPLGRRKSYANSAGMGLGVAEIKVRDPKAIGEVNRLLNAIFGDESSAEVDKPVTKRKTTTKKAATKKVTIMSKKDAAKKTSATRRKSSTKKTARARGEG